MKKILRLALFVFAAGLIAGALAVWSLGQPIQPAGETFIRIDRGSGTASIARTLQHAGVIRYPWQLYAAHLLNPSAKLQAGEYRFSEPATVLTVFDRLRKGDIFHYDFTIPE